jgi:hypothetical protein
LFDIGYIENDRILMHTAWNRIKREGRASLVRRDGMHSNN